MMTNELGQYSKDTGVKVEPNDTSTNKPNFVRIDIEPFDFTQNDFDFPKILEHMDKSVESLPHTSDINTENGNSDDLASVTPQVIAVEKTDVKIEYDQPIFEVDQSNYEDEKLTEYQCDMCDKVFNWKSNLITHFLVHEKKSEDNDCNSENYILPISLTNIDDLPHKCKVCGKGFKKSGNLSKHMRCHTGEQPYGCNVCPKRFSYKSDYNRHVKIHTGVKPHNCAICNKNFINHSDLTKHMRVHTGEEPYKCSVCGRVFSERGNLTKHMRIHTGERPFKCNLCPRAFSHGGNLTRHVRVHTGEKPYECEVCKKRFSFMGDYKKHRMIHTGEKPFECTTCGKQYSNKGDLTRHFKTHSIMYKCDQCEMCCSKKLDLTRHKKKIHKLMSKKLSKKKLKGSQTLSDPLATTDDVNNA